MKFTADSKLLHRIHSHRISGTYLFDAWDERQGCAMTGKGALGRSRVQEQVGTFWFRGLRRRPSRTDKTVGSATLRTAFEIV